MATYPSGFLIKGDVINDVDVYDQNDHNILKGEIIALEQTIGTNPHGHRPNLAARLNAMINPSGYLISSAGVPQPTAPGFLWMDTTADAVKVIRNDNTILTVGGSVSNVLFHWVGHTVASTSALLTNQSSLLNTNPAAGYSYFQANGSVTAPFLDGYFLKISGINTISSKVNVWGSAGGTTTLRVIVGSVSQTVVTSSVTPTWISTPNLDVSALTNGTYYQILFTLQRTVGGASVFCGGATLFGA